MPEWRELRIGENFVNGWRRVGVGIAVSLAGAGAGVFLISQGLNQASLWSSVFGLPLSVIGTTAGAWATVLAARSLSEQQSREAANRAGDPHDLSGSKIPSAMLPATPPLPVTAVRYTLPRGTTAFTGREVELRTLMLAVERASQTGQPVVIHAIDGMAGVGKTALAIHAAHQLAPHFPDGQLFLALHAHTAGQTPVTPAEALTSLLRSIGMDPRHIPASDDEKAAAWRDRLAGKRLLLVLDDAEGHQQVNSLIPGISGCAVIVTSRRRLAAIPEALPLPLDTLPPDEAATLFTRLCERASTEPHEVAEIVHLAGYLPLAICLLAGRLVHHPVWTASDLVKRLAVARSRSTAINAENEPVSAAFKLSYNYLPSREQDIFRFIGIHPGVNIDAFSAAALAGVGVSTAQHSLEALYDYHLLDEPTPGRYRLHDLLRDYANALATADPANTALQYAYTRLWGYYKHAAFNSDLAFQQIHVASKQHSPAPDPDPEIPKLQSRASGQAWFDAERANITSIVDHAIVHNEPHIAMSIIHSSAAFLIRRGHWSHALTLHGIALRVAMDIGDQEGQAKALVDLGDVQRVMGDYVLSTETLTRALNLNLSLDDSHGEATALSRLGNVKERSGDFEGATKIITRALDLFQAIGDQHGEAHALSDLGLVRQKIGDYSGAAEALTRALELCRSIGDQYYEAHALNNLGIVHESKGEYQDASRFFTQALDLYQDLGDRNGEAFAIHNLGVVQLRLKDYAAADHSFTRALTMLRELGNQYGQFNALNNIGMTQHGLGNGPEAARLLTEALAMARTIGYRYGEAEVLNDMGNILHSADPSSAIAYHRQALQLAQSLTIPLEEAEAEEGIGRCLLNTGNPSGAQIHLKRGLDIYHKIGAPAATQLAQYMEKMTNP